MKKLLAFLFCICIFSFESSSVYAAENSTSCQGLTITPQKTAYSPGETVTLSAVGSGFVSGIKMYYMPAMQNLTQTDPYLWQEITTGSFNPTTKTWTGTWTVPNQNGEYLITPNIVNGSGGLCTGNPGYTCVGCESGTFAGSPAVNVSQIFPSSSLNSSFSHTNLTDANNNTAWSSTQRTSADISSSPEWLTIDLGTPKEIGKMTFTPRVYQGQVQAFPINFHLAYSDNGTNWTVMPDHIYTNYSKPGVVSGEGNKQVFLVSGTHRYWSIGITKLGQDIFGGYYAQLAEVEIGGKVIEPGITSCSGCRSTLVVNSNFGNTTGFDMTKYWNFSPGNSWNYTGTNYRSVPSQTFKTRFEIEEKVNMCGYNVLPWRFTKDSAPGYWYPKDPVGVDGLLNLRFFISYFESGARWSPTSIGGLFLKTYNFPAQNPNPISSIGTFCPTCSITARTFDSRPFAHTFYAPYLYGEKNIPNLWKHERVDKYYAEIPANFCALTYDPNPIHRVWKIQYIQDNVSTPAYSGPALRFRQIEGDYPNFAFWHIREDWWFAEGIGIVQIDEKNLLGKCPGDPDCLGTGKMLNPQTQLKLTSNYSGQPLTVSLSAQRVAPAGVFTINIGNSYTGQLEVKSCVGETCTPGAPKLLNKSNGQTVWVNNGVVTLNVGDIALLSSGKNHLFFRPPVQVTPQDTTGETRVSNTQLPWSNEVVLEVAPVFTLNQLINLFVNYKTNLDSQYFPSDGKVNSMDAVYVLLRM